MKILVRADAEKEIEETSRKESKNIKKKIIAKALYTPSSDELYLKYETLIRQEAGKPPQEIIVIKKTNEEQDYVIPEDSLKTIEDCDEGVGSDRGIRLHELLHLSDITHAKTEVLLQTSMAVLEELEKEGILIIDREKHELRQNPELMMEMYDSFLASLNVRGEIYKVVGMQLLNEFPELKRK